MNFIGEWEVSLVNQELKDYLEMKILAVENVDTKGFIDDYSFALGKLAAYDELVKEFLELG